MPNCKPNQSSSRPIRLPTFLGAVIRFLGFLPGRTFPFVPYNLASAAKIAYCSRVPPRPVSVSIQLGDIPPPMRPSFLLLHLGQRREEREGERRKREREKERGKKRERGERERERERKPETGHTVND